MATSAMARHERLNAILERLVRDGRLMIEPFAAELGVSAATLRRDLDHLAQQQLLTRTHGGAVSNSTSYDLPLGYKVARRAAEKRRIAAAAVERVPQGRVVGLNGGTTTTEVARALATRADLHAAAGGPTITVVTNALNIANELVVRPHVKIVVTGGVVRPQSYELIGPLAMPLLEQVTLDFAILGVNAVDPVRGASAHHEGEAGINRLMASRATTVMVVADSTKLGAAAFARICGAEEIDVLITDAGASDEAVKPFEDFGVTVVRV